ncbi:MAG: 3-methyl-2-oxobutanoate hydroxymethyltransferase [Gammaproteobacteria bacterium (ex Lamellibrachia satsuma)]|nr:MAG: 3-methyl-2-oxobutanoate hydroxymethyltransferase [Gammaproteobacteria bacterium (ex Lamellibrachia satsuma)]RRS33578.1 MAG: 3-methyl-2-oxobutanoate hydroxymethyltransferase [Gammaproteobacteria bacterium (ex Lamellibrachia satsuma)]RRS34991.1 MAG: 3-methyl-2-oxobutanoate hydroxymethyltransferase [Gammaproteobacteria bacterium (ex Lamellibrachia satsuma)]
MSAANITVNYLLEMKQAGRKISCITSYDASFTRLIENAGAEVLLVGDSLGMVVQGQESTLPVTVDEMVYHTRNVARVRQGALLVADMPFMSYRTPDQAMETAGRLMKEGGAQMVKLEGGGAQLEAVRQMTSHGVPVCGHLGLLPQSVFKIGGYRVQGREKEGAERIMQDAFALQDAGVQMLVLECIPAVLATEIARAVVMPVIGIGAGAGCDGQVLVIYDLLGMNPNPPRFVKDFLLGRESIQAALWAFVEGVRQGEFPGPEESFS